VRFVTLTQQDLPAETAAQALRRVRAAMSTFQKSATWRHNVAGGIIKFEVERSSRTTRMQGARRRLDSAEVMASLGFGDDADKMRADAHNQVRRERRRGRGSAGAWWHAHAHCAVSSGFWSVEAVRASWGAACVAAAERLAKSYEEHAQRHGVEVDPHARILRDWLEGEKQPVVVDMQRPDRGVAGVLDELCKYITKPLSLGKLSVDEVADLVDAIAGRRLLRCTGALRGIQLEDDESEESTTTTEATLGDGFEKPIAMVDDPSSLFGKRMVYLDDVEGKGVRLARWRDDDDAQEERRRRLELAWSTHQARRLGVAELPEA
jgi:hypothetical protein